MFEHLVVPVDGSAESFRAVPIASRMVESTAGRLEVITVVDRTSDMDAAREMLAAGLAELGPLPVEPTPLVHVNHTVAGAIANHLEHSPGGMVMMSAHGHGRSAAILGSTTDAILREIFGPVIVVGPHVDEAAGRLDGTYVVPLDGSHRSDSVLPIVAAWATEFGGTPWLVSVVDESYASGDVLDSALVSNRATDMRRQIARPVEFEVLHGDHAARAVVRFAEDADASLVFLATHGRTGFERLRLGSVAADIVRHAHCPVVLFRPPELAESSAHAHAGSATS